MTWKQGKHYGCPWIYQDVRLSNGQKLRLGFSWEAEIEGDTWVEAHMCVYRGLYSRWWSWRKQGQAIGPGGIEVWETLRPMFLDAERELLLRIPTEYVTMAISGANDRLFNIYRYFLRGHGYWQQEDEMIKYLR